MAGGSQPSRTPRSLVYSRGVNKVLRLALIAAAFWTAVALVFALPSLSDRFDWHVLLASFAHWWAWGVLAPAITAIDDRLPVKSQQRLAAHLGIGLILTVVYGYVSAVVTAARKNYQKGCEISTYPDMIVSRNTTMRNRNFRVNTADHAAAKAALA